MHKVVRHTRAISIRTDMPGEAGGIMWRADNWQTLEIIWSSSTEYDLDMPPGNIWTVDQNPEHLNHSHCWWNEMHHIMYNIGLSKTIKQVLCHFREVECGGRKSFRHYSFIGNLVKLVMSQGAGGSGNSWSFIPPERPGHIFLMVTLKEICQSLLWVSGYI